MSFNTFFRALGFSRSTNRSRPIRKFEDMNAHRRFFVQHIQPNHWAELLPEDMYLRTTFTAAAPLHHYITHQFVAVSGQQPTRFLTVGTQIPGPNAQNWDFAADWEPVTSEVNVLLFTPAHVYASEHQLMCKWYEGTQPPAEVHDGARKMTIEEAKTFMRFHSEEGLAFVTSK